MKKKFTRWDFVCWMAYEFLKTLSNQKSFFSSKRLERVFLFTNAIIWLDIYAYINIRIMTNTEAILMFGTQLAYAGFVMKEISKVKRESKTTEDDENSDV